MNPRPAVPAPFRPANGRVVDGRIVEGRTPDEFFGGPSSGRSEDVFSKIFEH